MVVNKAGLARLTGRSLPAVSGWIRRGLPTLGQDPRSREWRIDTAAALDWMFDQPTSSPGSLDLAQERAREARARTEKYELENSAMRRRLISADEVAHLWAARRALAEARFRDFPARVRAAGILPNMTPDVEAGLARMIEQALAELVGAGMPAAPGAE